MRRREEEIGGGWRYFIPLISDGVGHNVLFFPVQERECTICVSASSRIHKKQRNRQGVLIGALTRT
jgi:hypothetical protein